MSYLLQTTFTDKSPPSADGAPISFSLDYSAPLQSMKEIGAIQTQSVRIENISLKTQGMLVAVLSVPSCMVVEQEQLELLKESGDIDNYEVSADNTLITVYFTYLKENETKTFTLDRTVTFGGEDSECLSRASQAFLYYNDEQDVWVV